MVACYCKCRPGSFGQGGSSRDLGIGFLGQMHGLVLLDQKKTWCDLRLSGRINGAQTYYPK
jgi:hypothetical protein